MEEWKKEYLRSHPERHNIMHSTNKMKIEVGDVVFIKREKKNKGKWSIEIVEDLCMGKADEIRGVRLQIQYFTHSNSTAIWKNQQVNPSIQATRN